MGVDVTLTPEVLAEFSHASLLENGSFCQGHAEIG